MATIDEGDQDKLFIKLVNHLTGEITEVEISSAEQAKNLLLELNASETAIRKAKDQLKYYLDRFLGDDEKYIFSDGKVLQRKQRVILRYRVESLRKFLDEDQLDVVLKVDNSAAELLISEMQEKGELPPGTLKQVREEAEQKATGFWVEIR